MQETILGELISVRIHAGPVFALARIQENIFEKSCSTILANFLRELISVRIHVALVVAPARIQKEIPGESFMDWVRARGHVCGPVANQSGVYVNT